MIERRSVVVLASAAALTLAMSQGWSAETATSGPAAETPSGQAVPVEASANETRPPQRRHPLQPRRMRRPPRSRRSRPPPSHPPHHRP